MSSQAPRSGLTRRDTGHPAWPYRGWYWQKSELPKIERRAKYRHTTPPDAPDLPDEPSSYNNRSTRTPKVCPTCERSFVPRVPWQSFCKTACRHKDEMRRQREKRNGKAVRA